MAPALAASAGELIWRAGPIRKGAGLCHGTAGNGFAFLKLLHATGDERWRVALLDRSEPTIEIGGRDPPVPNLAGSCDRGH